METPQVVLDLVDRFECNRDVYRSNQYNETQARHEFIDPFFKALGWDVNNEKGYAEAYKEVIHEDAIKVGGATKAPDYAFRLGGVRKFFVEAKRPGVNIKDDENATYQLRRYAWSAKLPLSILTDFEEFAVYDCRVKPDKADKASTARVLYLTLDKYAEQWDEIAAIFSQDAILTGSFDKYIESTKRKKGTAEVDTAFLKEIEAWRDVLARNIALRNTDLSTRELNFAVQRTIDRIIFLRICEDRGIEGYGQLMALQNGTETYKRVCQIFRRADERYNSGLFHFRKDKDRTEPPDGLTLNLTVDDKVLKGIVKELYYPESPYEFSVLPADILGHIYEQFLGKVIRLTPAHRAVVEDKPEVKKAGGVYYTPTYIVGYIVEHTVGKLLDGKTPNQLSKLRVLDPACGSGSFLLGAYQTLLDWHLKWYAEHDAEKHARGRQPKVFRGPGGDWRLTTAEKKRILLNNIYGVDIDPQAVEVTKLSLLLKVLEGENAETLGKSLRLFHERALPDLADNIKCGNSLIGPDFYEGKQLSLIDEEERYRINAFDWNAEFPEIMQAGGFDAVIGNPPYGAEYPAVVLPYIRSRFSTYIGRGESYLLFVEKGLEVLRQGGEFAYIIPDTYLNLGFTNVLRDLLFRNSKLQEIAVLPADVFPGSTVDSTLLFVTRERQTEQFHEGSVHVKVFDKQTKITSLACPTLEHDAQISAWYNEGAFVVHTTGEELSILGKADKRYRPLSNIAELFSGIKGYEVGKGNPPQSERVRDTKPYTDTWPKDESWAPLYDGKHVGRYELLWNQDNWIKYGPWLAAPRKPQNFEGEKILIRKIASKTLIATFVPDTAYCNTLLFILKTKPASDVDYKCLLGIMNSRFIGWYFRKKFQISPDDTFPQIMIRDILKFPIPSICKNNHGRMIELVDTMLKLHKDLQAAKTDHEKSLIQRQIDANDQQIDQLVYELYGLTDKEIEIVEEATK